MRQLLLFVKSWLNGLYLVAFVFNGAGVVLVLLPELKGQIWQIIEGALLGAGFTILVTTISARQSILEQYKKDANLQRKREVYGPLHAELRELREILDDARAGRRPFPQWIEIMGDEFRPSLYHTAYAPPTFSYWPMFKKNYHGDDDFTQRTQKLLEDVESLRADGLLPLSWFEDLFRDTLIELKKDPVYQYAMDAQERLFKRLLDAESKLKGVINYIRDRYQGGPPPV